MAFCILLFLTGCAVTKPPASRTGVGLGIVKQFRERYGIALTSTEEPYLRSLTERLLQSSPRGEGWSGPFDIVVVKATTPFAASVGDNFVVLTTGLVERLDVEAELSFILAHELAHYLLGHTTWVSRPNADLASTAQELPDLEKEADRLGLELLINAGYDPRLARIAVAKAYQGTNMLVDSSTHPSFVTRIAELEVALAHSRWVAPATVDRRAFQEFKFELQNL